MRKVSTIFVRFDTDEDSNKIFGKLMTSFENALKKVSSNNNCEGYYGRVYYVEWKISIKNPISQITLIKIMNILEEEGWNLSELLYFVEEVQAKFVF